MIIEHKTIKAKNPVLIAAWPGMGNVAVKAASHLKDRLKAKLFASLDCKKIFYSTDVAIHDGVIDFEKPPSGKFYHWENKNGANDLIIFISDLQPPSEKGMAYAAVILNFALSLKVKMIFTFAAMLTSMDYTPRPKVWLAVTHKKLLTELQRPQIQPVYAGNISGLNGLFLGLAKKQKISGACFLAEIPFYTTQIENPYASSAALYALTQFLNIPISLSELSIAGKMIEEEIDKLVGSAKKHSLEEAAAPNPISLEDIDKIKNILAARSGIPHSIKSEIEDLFSKAQTNLAVASDLKKKLDEWNIYKDYEDRFLGLFKKGNQEESYLAD